MDEESEFDDASLTERFVLLALAELQEDDRTPANALALLDRCREREEERSEVVCGRFSEADLVSACRSLAGRGLVAEADAGETSPAGKGRPEYDLSEAVDVAAVRELAREDERLTWIGPEADSA